MNVFLPGLGFAYSLKPLFTILFGVIPISFIGAGILFILKNSTLTAILWTAGVLLHLGAIYVSTKVEIKRKSTILSFSYFILATGYLMYCFVEFFIDLMEILKIHV